MVGRFESGGYCVVAAEAFSRCCRWLKMRRRVVGWGCSGFIMWTLLALAQARHRWKWVQPWGGKAGVTVAVLGTTTYMGTIFRPKYQQEQWVDDQRGKRCGFLRHHSRNCPHTNYLVSVHIFSSLSFFYLFCIWIHATKWAWASLRHLERLFWTFISLRVPLVSLLSSC